MTPLADLIPPGAKGVGLGTLIGEAATMEQGTAALMASPDDDLGSEIEYFERHWRRLPASAGAAADASGRGRLALANAAVAAYQALIGPYWAGLFAQLRAEQAVRIRILASRGGAGLLASLQSRWAARVAAVALDPMAPARS